MNRQESVNNGSPRRPDPVESWLLSVQVSHSSSKLTGIRYRRELKLFTDFIGLSPEQIREEYESSGDRKFRHKYAELLRAFIVSRKKSEKKYAPNTIYGTVAAVKSFFKYSNFPLDFVPSPKMRIRYHNRDITKEEIASIIFQAKARDRAFFYMMAQSGLRPSTLSNLRYKDIKEEYGGGQVPMKIRVPAELSKGMFGSYFTFVGPEAVNALRVYLRTRPNIKPDDYLFISHRANEKVSTKSVSKTFNKIIRKLEKREAIVIRDRKKGKPAEVRLYNLRKFFRKHAGQAGVEYVNFWMGHKTNYGAPHIPASDAYYFDRDDVEFHRKLYAEKAMPHLRIERATPIETESLVSNLQRQLEEKDQRIKELEKFKSSVETRLDDLKKAEDYIRSVHEEMRSFEEDGAAIVFLKNFLKDEEAVETLRQALRKKK